MRRCFPRPEVVASIALWVLAGCRAPVQEQPEVERDPYREQFVRTNRYLFRRHQDHISAFVERVGWDAVTTPSGLWVVEEDRGNGPPITQGSRVTYTFHSRLLDGTPCYEAGPGDPEVVVPGSGGIISGVAEGLGMLREGAEAVFLIPPHLGHGNFGDRNRIPGNTVLIYRVKILDVEQPG